MSLPKLVWRPSPNISHRGGTPVNLLVLHDMEGSYTGSVAYFQMPASQVSAHFCLRADGLECTQMVHLADKAWAVCNYNSRSVSLEMEGYAKYGYKPELLSAAAEIFAYLAAHLQIPIRHARAGVGPGICSHYDLGKAGGNHQDPSTDSGFMDKFIALVQAAYDKHDFPQVWDVDDAPTPCRVSAPPAAKSDADAPLDLTTVAGVQRALNALGAHVDVDGDLGPETKAAVEAFQTKAGLVADGGPGPITQAALSKALSGG